MNGPRWVQEAMGTTVTLAGPVTGTQAQRIFDSIDEDEARFSRFLPGSELSRFARGELSRDQASPDLRQLLTRCDELREATDGDFDHEPRASAPDEVAAPTLDPNAFAKGWIIDRAVIAGIAAGARSFSLNAGGDIAIIGERRETQRVGIVNPSRRDRIAAVLEVGTGAVASSGRYERGNHLRSDPQRLQSATVIGPTLGVADALATAALVSGETVPSWWDRFPDYALLTIDNDETLWMTDGIAPVLRHPVLAA